MRRLLARVLIQSLLLSACLLAVPEARSQAAAATPSHEMPPLQFAALGSCKLESGATIEGCRLGYRTFGTLNASRSNAVLFLMWFTGHSGDVGALVGQGAGHLVDTNKYFVVVIDPFGNGISSSPSNSTSQHGTAFPVFTIRDMVMAEQRVVRDTLQLAHLRAVMGQSMGGMQTFEWVADAPTMMDLAVPVVGTPQLTSYDMFLRSAEKQALEDDPAYQHGAYTSNPRLPMVAYLHQMNLSTPKFRVDHTTREQFPEYFARVGQELSGTTDANDYLRQLQAMLSMDIAHGGDMYRTVQTIQAKMLIINAEQDHMVNPIPALAVAKLQHAQTIVLHSDCGHMAPGCEIDTISPEIDRFLAGK